MIYRTLGRTGLTVSALGMGCYQFTQEFGVKPDTAEKILDYAMEHGITYYDTAHCYGFGESEELVGRALRRYPQKEVHVSTKVGYMERILAWVWGKCLRETDYAAHIDPVEIKRLIKHSMWLLQLDTLEILNIHEFDWPMWQIDYDRGEAVVISVLQELKKEGVIKNIGLGGWNLELAAKLVKTGKFDVVLPAGGFTLLENPFCQKLLPECQKQNTGVVLGGGFGSGIPFLVKKDPLWIEVLKQEDSEELDGIIKKLEQIYKMVDDLGITLAELTVRYILGHEEIQCHVAGAREVEHLAQNIASVEKGLLPEDCMRELNRIQNSVVGLDTANLRDLAKKLESKVQVMRKESDRKC